MANLYDKAGLVNIPVGYQDGFLYNIKPTDNTLGFRFNRDSAATRVNKKGLIEQVGYFGPELVTNGNFDTDSNWSKGTGWSIADGKANVNSTSFADMSQDISSSTGKTYKITFSVSNYVSGSVKLLLGYGGSPESPALIASANGIYEVEATTNAVNPQRLYISTKTPTTNLSIDNVSVKEVLGDKPRIDYTDSLTSPSFLLEPQSTNLLTYSEDFSDANWTVLASGETIVSNSVISPDGSLNADTLQGNGSATNVYVRQDVTLNTSVDYTFSIFAKKGTNNFLAISAEGFSGATNTIVIFDLNNGVVTTGTANMEDYGNGWFRCSYTIPISTDGTGRFLVYPAYDGVTRGFPTSSDANGQNIYLWGAQVEALSYATSYIPTEGSTVTRAQETCTGAGSASTFNSTEGVLYAEIAALADDETFRMISVSDGTDDNRVRINYTATNQQIQSRVVVGGAQQANISKNLNVTDFTKIALSYKQNQVKLYINGELIGTDTSVTMPSANTFNVLNFDGSNGSNIFYGKTKGVYVFNEALTDDELQQLTGPEYNSFAALAAAYNYTVI